MFFPATFTSPSYEKLYSWTHYKINNDKYIIRCYCVIIYVSHFWSLDIFPISVQSLFYMMKSLIFTHKFLLFTLIYIFCFSLCRKIMWLVTIYCLWLVYNYRLHSMCGWGGGWGHVDVKKLYASVHEILFWRANFWRQDKARYRVPVQLPVFQGTGKSRYADHAGVRPRNCDFDLAVHPTTYL